MKKITLLFFVLFAFGIYSCNKSEIDSVESSEFESSEFDPNGQGKNGKNDNNVDLPYTDPVVFESIEDEKNYCGVPVECTFIAGQNIDAGSVTVSNDEDYLYVKVYSKAGFQNVSENIKMWIGLSPPDRRPPSGQFPYKVTETGDTHIFKIALETLPGASVDDECGKQYVIIVHGDVLTEEGNSGSGETAYGGCELTGDQPWWAYMDYKTQCCEETMDAFAYKVLNPVHSFCFADDNFNTWGWSNELLSFDWRAKYNPLSIPIFVNGQGCDYKDAIEIGYVMVKVIPIYPESGGKEFYVRLNYVLTDSDYMIKEANLHIGTDKYPLFNGAPSVDPDSFKYQNGNLNVSQFDFTQIDWPTVDSTENVFIIPHLKVFKK